MLTFSDRFKEINTADTYFAGANTPHGFSGQYGEIFSEDALEKMYIIKGGPGTGKSTLMKRIAMEAEALGAKAEYYLCSSDPESLDAVVVKKGDHIIGIADGTAPHSMDPVYPGACGELFDCGRFWDGDALQGDKQEIARLCAKKREAFERAYRYIAAAGEIYKMQERIAGEALLSEKMESAAGRLISTYKRGKGRGTVRFKRTAAISMRGAVRVTSFENVEERIAIDDKWEAAPVLLQALLKGLTEAGHDVWASVSPFGCISELYVPTLSLAFVPKREGVIYKKEVNLRRFVSPQILAETKQKRIFASKCMTAMLSGATEALTEARESHFALESIYRKAMDFRSLERAGSDLCQSICKRL